MILLLDTSTPTCKLWFVDGENLEAEEWEAGRGLADGLLGYLEAKLNEHQKTFHHLTGIGVFRGPGSFTGLRIGMTVCNTLADALSIPIVGAMGEDWQQAVRQRLQAGENDKLVLPEYGREANITKPKK